MIEPARNGLGLAIGRAAQAILAMQLKDRISFPIGMNIPDRTAPYTEPTAGTPVAFHSIAH